MIAGDSFAELLRGPQGCGVSSHVAMQDSSRAYLHDYKKIQEAKMRCHHRGKITGDKRVRVVSHEGHPALG